MKYTYLLINIFTLLFPLIFSFHKKIAFYKKWGYLFPAIIITAVFFLLWDWMFTAWGVWAFNDEYILGTRFFGMPLEEYLFFFTIPFSCVFIYECLKNFIKKDYLYRWRKPLTIVISLVLLATLYFHYNQLYTATAFSFTLFYLLQILVIYKVKWLGRFYIAYAVCLIPFFIVNGILTALPIVTYNDLETTGIRIGSIPVEDTVYNLLLLLMNISIYESLQAKVARLREKNYPEEEQENAKKNDS